MDSPPNASSDVAVNAPATFAAQPRARGRALIAAKQRDGASRIADLYETGSAKVRVPRLRESALQAVMLNTAGGLTGGDHLTYEAEAGPETSLVLATQTAERAYRAQPGQTARLDVTLRAGPGATLAWLAQETILFDRCALHRRLRVDLAEDARALIVEPLVLGRLAMGETVAEGRFRDSQRITRGGRLIYADESRLEGDIAALAARPTALVGNLAYATVLYVGPDATDRLDTLRTLLGDGPGGASAFDGMISARIVSPDGYLLRRRLMTLLRGLDIVPVPRVWEM
jgi:urease accessory protein